MSVVYEAIDPQLRRPVAIKVLKGHVVARSSPAELLAEAHRLAAVGHRNVVTIHETGITGDGSGSGDGLGSGDCLGDDGPRGRPYLVMELLTGQTLADWLPSWRPVKADRAVAIALGVARGVAAVHARGLVHRDLKPANVWVEWVDQAGDSAEAIAGGVRLLDFGLAEGPAPNEPPTENAGDAPPAPDRRFSQWSRNAPAGTLGYLSPEQARGEPLSPRSDLYNIGLLLYEMLTGQLPHRERQTSRQLVAVAIRPPKPIGTHRDDLPAALTELIDRLLAKHPNGRPASATAVAEVLAAIAAGTTAPETPSPPNADGWALDLTPTRRSRPPSKPRPVGLIAAYAAAIVGPFLAVAAWPQAATAPRAIGPIATPSPAPRPVTYASLPTVSLATEQTVLLPTQTATVSNERAVQKANGQLAVRRQIDERQTQAVSILSFDLPVRLAIDDAALRLTLGTKIVGNDRRRLSLWQVQSDFDTIGQWKQLKSSDAATRLATWEFENARYRLNRFPDGVAVGGPGLADAIAAISRSGGTIRLVIERDNASLGQTLFETEGDRAPKLVLQTVRPADEIGP